MIQNPFTRQEYDERLARIHQEMDSRQLELLILNDPESIYYASGYQTRAIAGHQVLAVPLGRPPVFMTRLRDFGNFLGIADVTPIADAVTYDDGGRPPMDVFVDLLKKHGLGGGRTGIEKSSIYLTVEHYETLKNVLSDAEMVDASSIVAELRIIKSPSEIACHREAGRIVVEAMRAGMEATQLGKTDANVAAVVAAGLLNAGSEWIATWPVVRFGAQTGRSHSSWQGVEIEPGAPTTIETSGAVGRHHSPFYRTKIFQPTDEQRRISEAVSEGFAAGLAAVRPGVTASQIYSQIQQTIEDHGFAEILTGRCAYTVGIAFPPNWMNRMGVDILPTNQRMLEPGMVFHWLMILVRQNEMTIGTSSTIVVTENGYEDLTPGMERGPFLVD